MSKIYSLSEVAKHKSDNDCWIIVKGNVYDVTKFLADHPGGKKVLLNEGGKDATKKFDLFHKPHVLDQFGPQFLIGSVEGANTKKQPTPAPTPSSPTPPPSSPPKTEKKPASSAPPKTEQKSATTTNLPKSNPSTYGDLVPYCDPNWYQGWNSCFYTESHLKYRAQVREFIEKEVTPNVAEWDEKGEMDNNIFRKAYKAGILPGVIGPPWPEKYVGPGPEGFNAFHELILLDEMGRCGSGGVLWGLYAGLSIGLPPVFLFGADHLKEKVGKDCLMGEKFICLAISEPEAGSDVANLTTTARREGDYYIVNGSKKWITNGIFSDYFTTAVRTGGPGHGGISMLLIEKTFPGVTTRKMKCMGVWPSGTTYVTFEDVKVPVTNLIGKENEGFKYIMYNFNHERWSLIVQANRLARCCYEEAFKYALKRKTFGQKLIDHQMIRAKFADMARQIEATHAWLENITYQMTTMNKEQQNQVLGGPIALLKAQATKTFEYCAREAAQVFGGASYVRGGVGEKVERLYREVRAYAIPGGSEEIMMDFGIRQAVKQSARAKL